MNILNALKGIGGEPEISRLIGAAGSTMYILTVPFFVGYEVLRLGRAFDLIAFCLSFPGGLAACVGATAGAIAVKDTYVTRAKVTQETGSAPGLAANPDTPAGTVSDPLQTQIVSTPADPVNVKETKEPKP